MRPSSRLVVTLWPIALCFLAVLASFDGLASAQSAESKRKLSQHSLLSRHPQGSNATVHRATRNAPPPLTADSWTGTAGDNNWNTAGNWSAGVPTSSSAVTIGTATASVNMNVNGGNFGTLALSGSGDSLTILNGDVLNAFGNITNSGNLNLSSSANFTELVLQGNVTLSGGTLTMSNNVNNYILGSHGGHTDQSGDDSRRGPHRQRGDDAGELRHDQCQSVGGNDDSG